MGEPLRQRRRKLDLNCIPGKQLLLLLLMFVVPWALAPDKSLFDGSLYKVDSAEENADVAEKESDKVVAKDLESAAAKESDPAPTTAPVPDTKRYPPDFKGELLERIKSHGLGMDLHKVTMNLMKAVEQKKFLKVTWQQGYWIYAKDVCEKQDFSCYFEDPILEPPPKSKEEATRRLLVPKPEFQRDIDKGSTPSPGDCGVIHVRHSDIVLNYRWGQSETPVLKYLELGEYVARFKKEAPELKNIVLLTDDQAVIDDVANYEGKDGLKFYFVKRKRFRGAEGGWENHFPSESRYEEMVNIFMEKEIVSKCSLWVGTESGFARVLQNLMDPPPRVVKLDNGVPVKARKDGPQNENK